MPRVRIAPREGTLGVRWRAKVEDCAIALGFSPAGDALAAAAASGPVAVLDRASGAGRHALAGHRNGTMDLDWSADGRRLATAGQDGLVRLWEGGALAGELPGGSEWVERVAFQPRGATLASAAGRRLRLWRADGGLEHDFAPHASTVCDIGWRPDGGELVSAAYGGLTFWRPGSPEAVRRLEWKGSILALAWSPDGRHLATGDQDATVHFWIVAQGKDLQMSGYPAKVRELSWDSGGRYLATGGSPLVTIWDTGGRGPEGTRPQQLEGHEGFLSALAWQRRSGYLASGCRAGRVVVWHPSRSKRPLAALDFGSSITRLEWSPDDRALAIAAADGTVAVAAAP